MTRITESDRETINFGKELASKLKPGSIICLVGELGSGKTTLVKGICQGLKVADRKVNSPTFVLMNIYEGKKTSLKNKINIYHFDLYRLEDNADQQLIGYEEFFYGDGITIIEWADRLQEMMPKEYLKITLKHKGENKRSINLKAYGVKYENIIH